MLHNAVSIYVSGEHLKRKKKKAEGFVLWLINQSIPKIKSSLVSWHRSKDRKYANITYEHVLDSLE